MSPQPMVFPEPVVQGKSRAACRRQRRARNSTTGTVSEVEDGRPLCNEMGIVMTPFVMMPYGPFFMPISSTGKCADLGNSLDDADDSEKCRDLIAKFEEGSREQRSELAQRLAFDVKRFSLSVEGCRVVQKALETTGGYDRDELVKHLQPHIEELINSPHGNHVVAKMVEVMPPSSSGFVIEAIKGKPAAFARHRFGCRILERLIEHCSEQQMSAVLEEVVAEAEPLCRHPYGNFVVQHLLEQGSHSRRVGILQKLLPTLPQLAVHRTASHVVQKVINYSDEDGKRLLVSSLIQAQSPHSILDIATSRYGSFVVEEFASVNVGKEEVRHKLELGVNSLSESPFGEKLIDCFGLAVSSPPTMSAGTAAGTTPPIGGA